MAGARTPCITYCRQRESEPEANRIALGLQNDAEMTLEKAGYTIIDRYGDAEFAPPFSAWLEPRPGWAMAFAEAQRVAHAAGACTLVILYADGIGSGDPFLPDIEPNQIGAVEIRVCNFGLCPDPHSISLAFALAKFAMQAADLDKIWAGTQEPLLTTPCDIEIAFHHDETARAVRAYFCNHSHQPLSLRWQCGERLLVGQGAWAAETEWRDFKVAPASQLCLRVFLRCDPRPSAHWWRFKYGTGRGTRVGNVLFTPTDLQGSPMKVSWYRFEPC